MVEVVVEDQGPGIPEQKLESIFERFYSERPSGERFGQHSGLGLSISRQIVEGLRGRISAENIRDASGAVTGARFMVLLPAA
jgi:two-component system sensor histidine kinase ChvG